MRIVAGPFRPALEKAFQETFARLRAADPLAPIAIVAPSGRVADRLKRLALDVLPNGFAGARFFNLFSFAKAIYDEEPGEGTRLLLDDLVPRRLLTAVHRRHFAGEPYLGRAAGSPGPLLRAMHELKAANVDPDKAIAAMAEGFLGDLETPKLSELLSLHKRFSEELRRRKIHLRPDVVRLAADRAERSALIGSFRHVLYYGFYDLDQNQLDLLGKVRRRTDVTVFYPHRKHPDWVFAQDLLDALGGEIERRDEPPPAPAMTRISASGARDEVWAAAKEVLRLTDAGVPFHEIAVVARTLDPYVDLAASVFAEHRIPFTSSATRTLAHAPAVKAARLLFSLEEFDRADVLDLLRSPFFLREGGDPELWDAASRRMGVGRGADEWRARLGGAAGRDWTHLAAARAGGRKFTLPKAEVDAFWTSVRGLLDAPPPPSGGWAAFSAWALDRVRRFLKPDERVEAAIAALAELEGLAYEGPVELLLESLRDLSEPAGGEAGVALLDVMAARGLSFRAMIVLGMNERVFPRFIVEDAFFSDAFRTRVVHRLGNRLPAKLSGYDEERLLFQLLRGAADEIVFLHQRSDERGRLQIASSYLPAVEERALARRPAKRLAETPFDLLTPREASLRSRRGEELGRATGRDVSVLVRGLEFLEAVESRGALTPYDGRVNAGAYWTQVAGYGLSPTALEKLAECPFKFFAARMMDLEEREAPEEEAELDPIDIGQLYHDILESFHTKGDLEKRTAEAFAAFEKTRTIRYPVLWEVERDRIREVLKAAVKADDLSVFKPHKHELGLEAELPFAVGGLKKVKFKGYLDRLDLGPDGAFRVIDYKRKWSTSKYPWKTMETGVLKKGRYLQPPLYFLMAERYLGKADRARSSFSYYFLEDAAKGKPWVMTLDGEFWDNQALFDAMMTRLLETIPRGDFVIRPGSGCGYCDFRTICRRSHLPTRLRAAAVNPRESEGDA
ncbi:MAG TPA: PD-(D/E)XK nuclease family protein [Planctomycetota bacterium]